MRLSIALCRKLRGTYTGSLIDHYYKTNDMPYRYRGKFRKVSEPRYVDLLKLRHDFEREEQNMLILRHPYLTPEQSCGHMDQTDRKGKMLKLYRDLAADKFTKQVTIADRLNHMKVNEKWD